MPTARRWIILAAGLVALSLQAMAQAMPADAMQNAMRVAALTAEEAQSFAGTCLGFGQPGDGQPAKSGNHASCPVCFALAQAHGFAPAPITLLAAADWVRPASIGRAKSLSVQSLATAAFASRAPPVLLG
ncbi:hypothetical protein [Dongia mobilis]|uniref:DUF2946 family protein n=1 Tax=Dongia sp. TaxID=1977262 RepID=UPI0026ECA598